MSGRDMRRNAKFYMSVIADVYAREILDSRANPTIEVEVVLEDAISINASRKKFESVDLEALADMVDEDPYKSMFDKCESYYVNPKLKIKRKKVDESELRYDSRFVKKMN